MNLCTNAAHAMRTDGGILEISLRKAELDEQAAGFHRDLQPGTYVALKISDTGQGMPPAVLQRAFDPYFTTKEPGEGTGLGLSVAHGIVEAHGGAITAYSNPGEGSAFTVFLPWIEVGAGARRKQTSRVMQGHGRILLVDSQEHMVRMAKTMLEHLGYHVVSQTDSQSALALFESDPHGFDAVMTEMAMPKMPGDQLAEHITRIRSDIPVVLFTGYGEGIAAEKARGKPIRGLIAKPYSMKDLSIALSKILKKKRTVSNKNPRALLGARG
jgi:CheY-like chemotaxis protein